MLKKSFLIIAQLIIFAGISNSQIKPMEMAILENPLADFTLPVYKGGEYTLSKETGKKILLVFPRGYYAKDMWCDICPYQYFDMIDLYQKENVREKYNLEIVFILPYDSKTIEKWLLDMPEVNDYLVKSKNNDLTYASEKEKRWVAYLNKFYYKQFAYKRSEVPEPFKILVDEKHELSERLGIFRNEWWGTQVEQNIPTLILLDKDKNVIFKYVSQYTLDRPDSRYMLKIFETFLK